MNSSRNDACRHEISLVGLINHRRTCTMKIVWLGTFMGFKERQSADNTHQSVDLLSVGTRIFSGNESTFLDIDELVKPAAYFSH